MRASFLRAFTRFGGYTRQDIAILGIKRASKSTSAKQQRTIMAGSMATGTAYALSVSSPAAIGPVPDDAKDKKHHVKGGFTNPWDSFNDMSGPQIMLAMLK